jgi:hypothetical protein
MKNLYIILLMAIMLVPSAYADFGYNEESLGTFQKGDCIELIQTCSNCTYINLSIAYPNSTIAVSDDSMNNLTSINYNYSFCDTNKTGIYNVNGYGDQNGAISLWNYNFKVTENGLEEPSGIVTSLFIILLFAVIFGIFITFFIIVTKTALKELYLIDVLASIGAFISLISYNYLSTIYFANALVSSFTMILMKVCVWTHVYIPLIIFFIFIILNYRKFVGMRDNSDGYDIKVYRD